MQTSAKWVLGVIAASVVAASFTEPINWAITRYLDQHPDMLPGVIAQVWLTIQMAVDIIPSGFFPGIALGATIAFILLRGWRSPPRLDSTAVGKPVGGEIERTDDHLARVRQLTLEGIPYSKDAFLQYADAGDIEVIRRILDAGMPIESARSRDGYTALHIAVQRGYLTYVNYSFIVAPTLTAHRAKDLRL